MPHECTTCGRAFDDGSKEMLGGCPDCGGNKFQFIPPGAVEADPEPAPVAAPGPDSPPPADTEDDIIEAPAEPVEAGAGAREDRAQASARSDVVSPDELPPVGEDAEAAAEAESERPDLTQLRKELNEQFESIKILQPGEYELNLMELYDRQEYIIALEEDGRYVIEVPDTWQDAA